MNRRIKTIAIIATLLILGGAAAYFIIGRGERRPEELVGVSLRLPIPAVDTAFSPYYLAVDNGIFRKHGIDVTLEPGSPELNPVKMVAQGTDEFGVVGGPELLLSGRSRAAPIVGIALLHKDSDFVVVVSPRERGIDEIRELDGKRVGFFYGHISTDVLHMLFRKENIQVQEVDVGFDYGSLLAGDIDAQWAFRTTAGINLPARGVQINVISPAEYGIVTQGHMIITNEQMIRERPEVVQRFTDAVLEAIAYSLDHEEEAIAAAMKRDPNFQHAVGLQQLAVYEPTILRNSRIGWIAREDMERTKQQMVSVDLLATDFDVESAYTTQFLEKSNESSVAE